jgi:tRNA (cytidine32/uridine32-2'-O)-methyltransferase
VEPKEFPSPQAEWRASGATDLLAQATVVTDLSQAIADCQLVVGTSARQRRIPWPVLDPKSLADKVMTESTHQPIAIVFGREDRGLTNDELQCCHYHLHIPANPDYSSLNLAAAVQVVAYELRMASLAKEPSQSANAQQLIESMADWDEPLATVAETELFYQHLTATLTRLGFHNPANPRQLLTRLRRLYNRTRLDKMEVNILRGMLTAMDKCIAKSDQS